MGGRNLGALARRGAGRVAPRPEPGPGGGRRRLDAAGPSGAASAFRATGDRTGPPPDQRSDERESTERPGAGPGRPPEARRRSQPARPARPTPLEQRALVAPGDELVADARTVRAAAGGAVRRGRSGGGVPIRDAMEITEADDDMVPDARSELTRAVGATRAPRLQARLADASRAYRREQFEDAARILRRLAEEAPGSVSVRELYGITLYRLGRWRPAAKELEAFRLATGSVEQHPVLADCYRALERWDAVEELWEELRAASPSAELVIEGRIVAAAARADRGELRPALSLLQQGWRIPKRPQPHHLRRAYALADLYERAGEIVAARELFSWVARHDPSFADAKRRARQLG